MLHDEDARLRRLHEFGVLDTPAEERFDRITKMASELFDAPIALISLIDSDRQWFKSKIGLSVAQTPRDTAFCAHAIQGAPNGVMVIENASEDARFAANPLVIDDPHIRFYAGATLTTAEGDNLGTLCVIDRKPRAPPSERDLCRLRELAAMAVDEMVLTRKVREADQRLALLQLSESMSGVGFWRFDATTLRVSWSDQVYAIYGVDRGTFDPNMQSVLESYHPADRPVLEQLIDRALRTGEGYALELRVKRSDDQYRRVAAKAITETDALGKVIALTGVFQDVTEYALASQAIAESEARYKLLTEAASDVIFEIDASDVIKYVSPAIRQYGWSPDMMIGKFGASFIHPDDLERVLAAVSMMGRDDQVRGGGDASYRMRKADGNYAWVEASSSVVRNADGSVQAILCQLRDVSNRREAARALAESEARYRLIAENVTDVISRAGIDGKLLYVSPSARQVTGYNVEELIGASMARLIHPDDRSRVLAEYQEMIITARQPVVPLVYRARHKSGQWIWIEASPTVIQDESGRPVEFLSVTRDVSARIKLEAELRAATLAAEAAAAVKGEFLANMSHEIRTPLNGIVGYASLLAASSELTAQHRRHAEIISSSSRALVKIVDDVLDYSALDAGEVGFDIEPFDLRSVVQSAVETLQVRADEKGMDLVVFTDLRLEKLYVGDGARIRQALINLISNAIKFTNLGRIEIGAEALLDGSAQTVRCYVKDSGIGIAPEKQAGLFARFSQADSSISRRYGGTGLGLAITKKIILAMAGAIGVESEEGKGSTFWFTLPLAVADDAAALIKDPSAGRSVQPFKRQRILLVDDHDINRELGAVLLSPLGHEVVLASNGECAIQLVQREPFDLVFMDVQMPGMDGLAATRAIRKQPSLQRLPIVALTAHAMKLQVEECLRAGMNGHVAKPFTVQTLQNAIVRWASPGDRDLEEEGASIWSPELTALRRRFVGRMAEDAEEIERFLEAPSAELELRVKASIHRLAGTAGSLGFHHAGGIALALDATLAAAQTLKADALQALCEALNRPKEAA